MQVYLLFALLSLFLLSVSSFPECPPPGSRPTFDLVKDFGAVGDNKTLNTDAISKAVAAITKAGGGTIIVPSGIFLTAPFNVTSCMTLSLPYNDSFIQAITSIKDWPLRPHHNSHALQYSSFITGENVTDVTIQGQGIIDGAGYMWWPSVKPNYTLPYQRGVLIEFLYSQYLTFLDVTVQNSPMFNWQPILSQHIYADNLKILNPIGSHNTDGFDPDSCNNVTIANSYISTGDDVIAVKSGNGPSTNIFVRNLTAGNGHCGMCIGSHATGGNKNISIIDSVFHSTVNGFCFKGCRGAGGETSEYSATNILIYSVQISAININDYYPGGINGSKIVPITHDITIKNLTALSTGQAAGQLIGLVDAPLYNIHLEDVKITGFKTGWDCDYVNGTYRNVEPSLKDCPGMIPSIEEPQEEEISVD